MDKHKVKRYRTILVVFLVSVVTLFINPYISLNVIASQTSSTDFEDGVLTKLYNAGWLSTRRWDADFYISDEQAIGSKSFFMNPTNPAGGTCGQFRYNYTYDDDILINWSCRIRFEGMGNNLGGKDYTLLFRNPDNYTVIYLTFQSDENGNDWQLCNVNSVGGFDYIVGGASGYGANEWHFFSWQYNSIDNLTVTWNGTDYHSSPRNVITNGSVKWIEFLGTQTSGTRDVWIDNNAVVVDEYFPHYFGNVTCNVYNESNVTEAITNYNVTIYNSLGGLMEHYINRNNPFVINLIDVQGNGNYYFRFSHSNYSQRTFYGYIDVSSSYTITALLPPKDDSLLYYVRVLDSFTTGVYNANVTIRRIINGTSYDIDGGLTDSSGYLSMYLLPNVSYLVNVSKNGYSSLDNQVWFTQHDCYGYLCPKLFYLNQTVPDINITSYEFLHLTGTINSTGHISVHYADGRAETINTNMTIFESWNGTLTRNISEDRTGENVFTWVTSGYNTSKTHVVWLYVNHSEIWESPYFMSVTILPLDYNATDYWDIENKFIDVFGEFDLGWVRLLILFIPCLFLLVVFGSSHSGLGILSAGLWLGFSSIMISNIPNIANIVILAGILAILGILVAVAKKGRDII